MRAGVVLPICLVEGEPGFSTNVADDARLIESAGFDSIWTFDAIGRGFLLPDPLTALAVAASATSRVEVGTGVLQVAPRNAVELAQRVLTTQLVSDGRLVLGVGTGSTRADFTVLGADFDGRFGALTTGLSVMRTLWNGGRVGGAELVPWPATHGGPPVLIGSWASAGWIRQAATHADGWLASGGKANWARAEDGIRRFREAGGKRAILTNVLCRLGGTDLGESPDDPVTLTGSRDVVQRRLRRIARLGYDDVVLVVPEFSADQLQAIRELVP